MKTTIIYSVVLLFSSIVLVAQNRSLPELLSELEKNHTGAVSDVFNETEIQILQAHFKVNEIPSQRSGGGEEIFATENQNGDFGHFNRSNPEVFNDLSMAGAADFEGAGCYDPATNTFFIIDNVGNAYSINPVTGIYAFLGTVDAPNDESFTGIEVNPLTGTIFAISTNGSTSTTLSTIDPVTLAVNPLGNPDIVLPIALAFDLLGNLYTYDIDSDLLFQITVTTAVAIVIGAIGFNADFGQGMGMGADGKVYMSAFNGGTFRSELREVNTTTGMTTLVAPIGSSSPGGLLQFAWMSGFFDPTLSVGDQESNGFAIYPNPVQDLLQINGPFTSGTIRVYQMNGALVMETNLSQNLEVSSLSSGMYLLEIETSDGIISTQKFLKQ